MNSSAIYKAKKKRAAGLALTTWPYKQEQPLEATTVPSHPSCVPQTSSTWIWGLFVSIHSPSGLLGGSHVEQQILGGQWAGEQPGAPGIIRGWIIFQLEGHQLQPPVLLGADGMETAPVYTPCPPFPFRQSLIFWGHQTHVPNAQYSLELLIWGEGSPLC